jgi:hypothetical protein
MPLPMQQREQQQQQELREEGKQLVLLPRRDPYHRDGATRAAAQQLPMIATSTTMQQLNGIRLHDAKVRQAFESFLPTVRHIIDNATDMRDEKRNGAKYVKKSVPLSWNGCNGKMKKVPLPNQQQQHPKATATSTNSKRRLTRCINDKIEKKMPLRQWTIRIITLTEKEQ